MTQCSLGAMCWAGHRSAGGGLVRPRYTRLVRPALLVGWVLAAAAVFFAALDALSGPSAHSTAARTSAGAIWAAPPAGAVEAEIRVNDPTGQDGGAGGTRPPASSPVPRATARVSCTKEVLDEAGLREAVARAGPNDVICVKTNLPRTTAGPAPTPVPPPAPPVASPAQPAPAAADRGAGSEQRGRAARVIPPRGTPARGGDPAAPKAAGDNGGPGRGAGLAEGGAGRAGGSPREPGGNPDGVGGGSGGGSWPGGPVGAGTPAPSNCTRQVRDSAGLSQALSGAAPGDQICVTGDLGTVRLRISTTGSDQTPLVVIGPGKTAITGITVEANNVLGDGFPVLGATPPEIEISENGITVRTDAGGVTQGYPGARSGTGR